MTEEIDICKNMVNHLLSELQEEKRKNDNLTNKINFILTKKEKQLICLNNSWQNDYKELKSYCNKLENIIKNYIKII